MANVFISYRRSDFHQVEKIANEVRQAGHKVWLDEWEIQLGDSITGRMNAGLSESAYVIVCCSSAGITSPWMGREWMSSLARQLNDQQIKLLPVLLDGGAPPAILADIKYANLGRNWSAGIAELLRAIK
ncbi:toll/interleukin-1 receptor domain-containing protein [Pyxidicoccus sp. 3LFB2]